MYKSLVILSILSIMLVGLELNPGYAQTIDQDSDMEKETDPTIFVQNMGQFPEGVKFRVLGNENLAWIGDESLWATIKDNQTGKSTHLKISFQDANSDPILEPINRLDTHISYFRGKDPQNWYSDVPAWGGVRFKDLFPGFDLELTGRSGQFRWKLVNHDSQLENSRPEIRIIVEGAEEVVLEGDFLRVNTASGSLFLPMLFLEGAGQTYQTSVHTSQDGRIEILSPLTPAEVIGQDLASDLGAGLIFSTFLGGSGGGDADDEGRGIAVDRKGSAYITGYTQALDFPVTPGSFDTICDVCADAFVAKLNPSGTRLEYATFLGGNDLTQGNDIAIDPSGNAYITGITAATDFPTTATAFDQNINGFTDAFVAKLNKFGTALRYSTFLGGGSDEEGLNIDIGSNGSAYVTGVTTSSDFPTTPRAFDGTHNGSGDVFIAKLNQTGKHLIYGTFLGGGDNDIGYAIAVDQVGAVFVTGQTNSSGFPTTPGAFDTDLFNTDAFVTKLNPNGSKLIYSSFLGGSSAEIGYGISVDGLGMAYITGETWSFDFPITPDAFDGLNESADAFIVKIDRFGSDIVYSTFLGGSEIECESGCDLVVDKSGSVYVTGETLSYDFPTTPGAFDQTCDGYDAYFTKLSTIDSALVYSTCLGGSGFSEGGLSIAMDRFLALYITGWTSSVDFPTTEGAFDRVFNGGKEDIFVAKFQP